MFKSLLFLGALAPSMLSGNIPPRSLDNQPTLHVGDVYNVTIPCQCGDLLVYSSIQLFDDGLDGGTNLVSIDFSSLSFSNFSDVIPDNNLSLSYRYGLFSLDYFNITNVYHLSTSSLAYEIMLCEADDGDDNFSLETYVTVSLSAYVHEFSFDVSYNFTILDTNFTFNNDVLPYLTKVESPYTPPSKSNLYRLIYDFYYSLFEDDDLSSITTSTNLPFDSWLCHSLTIITLIGLVFILFLLLRWLFKVISGLILLKQ